MEMATLQHLLADYSPTETKMFKLVCFLAPMETEMIGDKAVQQWNPAL